MVLSEEKILSWQAYQLPRVIFDQIKRPRVPLQFTEGLPELTKFNPLPLASLSTRTYHNAASVDGTIEAIEPLEIPRTFENALAPLSLARRIVKIIEEHYCCSDMYKDPGERGSSSREMYQGIWWGPERIWMDDLVRLNASYAELVASIPDPNKVQKSLKEPSPGGDGRGILAHITEFTHDPTKKQLYFSARLYELAQDSPDLHIEEDLGLRQPGCLSAPAWSHAASYRLPEPPKGFRFRRITADDVEIYLPVQFIAGNRLHSRHRLEKRDTDKISFEKADTIPYQSIPNHIDVSSQES